jgi:phosphatidylserine/phosphatidylglycerophosphate/cardiolipin synthase-like enzyme
VLAFALLSVLYAQGTFDQQLSSSAVTSRSVETRSLVGFARGPVQVYFTRSHYPERAAERSGGLDETIAAEIDRATRSIDIAAFDLDLPAVTTALQNAHRRGVRVRVVLDGQNLEAPEVAAVTGAMQDAGIPLSFDRRPAFMHNKFLIVDASVVWTGSWNPTINDTFRNDNNFVRLADVGIAADYTAKFELLFAGRGGPGSRVSLPFPSVDLDGVRVDVAFAPDSNITGDVVQAINGAQESVEFLAFSFTSDPIAKAVVAAYRRGIRVRGVIESKSARGSGAELGTFEDAGVDVLEDGNCYLMHHKVFVIDGRRVVTGSFNWSANAQDSNDENVILVDDAWFARLYQQEFQRIYEQARAPMRCGS